jgi:ubiquinone/menaquinone biosynthesis C-methylase UbiE
LSAGEENSLPKSWTIDDERIVPLELAETLYEKVGTKYKLGFYRHLASYEFALTHLKPQDRVLDVGCGTGYGSSLLAGSCAEVVGIDYSADAIEYALKQYSSPKCSFICGDAAKTDLAENSFDAVCSVQVIEHMQDQEGFVKEVKRVLTPGGVFVAATPNTLTYSPGAEVGFDFHYKEYEPAELVEFLAGFFPTVELYGLFAKSILARLMHDKDMSLFWRRSWIRLMPRLVRKEIRRVLWRRNRDSEVSTADYEVAKDRPMDDSLDLIAVCRKGND